ncbi:MAG: type II 3-dehydroquinate dehydratase [Clostridia bacterium]|nr:type II 3-dehydroquinate dehydratase [Clostridia bacterium]
MKFLVINGPNINLLGIREPDIYGTTTYPALLSMIDNWADDNNITVECFQSNHEGAIVDKIQSALTENIDGIVINPAAYTHTSIAIRDALRAVAIPAVEVHISDINGREEFRHISYVRDVCSEHIIGQGIEGYITALEFLKNL